MILLLGAFQKHLWALKSSPVNKIYIFQYMGKIFCVEFQRYPLKFHTKYLNPTLKDMILIQHWNLSAPRFKRSYAILKRPLITYDSGWCYLQDFKQISKLILWFVTDRFYQCPSGLLHRQCNNHAIAPVTMTDIRSKWYSGATLRLNFFPVKRYNGARYSQVRASISGEQQL